MIRNENAPRWQAKRGGALEGRRNAIIVDFPCLYPPTLSSIVREYQRHRFVRPDAVTYLPEDVPQ